jgi:hypothetical protein
MESVPTPKQYITSESGERVGVVIAWDEYEAWHSSAADTDLLTGLSSSDLLLLADGMLASSFQERLNDLLHKAKRESLSDSESAELDALLEQVDELNILKARASYTLQQLAHDNR